ncbi:hypothetical protein [Flavobacterium sp.]|uniref:hypothetical protein n=1 Tax=Flavobacterium sp. TaxID=239 RepID=UPI003752F190
MSTASQNNDNQEIDLSQISKKIGSFLDGISSTIFEGILFLKRNILVLGILFVLGAGLGYYLDDSNKTYKNEVIVSPNMGGTDYLYAKIELLSSKLGEHDTNFFNSIGIKNSKNIALIEVEPVIDIYEFVNTNTAIATNAQNTQNFELMKLLAEDNDINKVIKDQLTSKNYPHHTIRILTNGKTSNQELILPLLKYLNTDPYYNKICNISYSNTEIKMKKNEVVIDQVDSLIGNISKNISKNQKSSNLIYNNENNQLSTLFDLKNNLINEIASQKIQLINLKSFIKDLSTTINIKDTKGTNGKMKLIIPFLFMFLFLVGTIFRSFYKKQLAKSKL